MKLYPSFCVISLDLKSSDTPNRANCYRAGRRGHILCKSDGSFRIIPCIVDEPVSIIMTLPNFIVIGVAKAGTTSLHRYLDQHPQVFMCPVKETNFFAYADAYDGMRVGEKDPPLPARFHVKTLEAYKALFERVTDEIAIGEASPRYFGCPTAPQRIRECIPDVKLVVSLRNPADRAFSGFLMRVRRGRATMKIRERLTPESHHVREGFYYHWLKRYFDMFPKHQIKVCIFEDFKEDSNKVVLDLFDFLGVSTNFVPDTSIRHNPAGVPKFRWLNRLFFDSTFIRTAKAVLPGSAQRMAKRVRQLNLEAPPKFPADLRAELLKLYREDIRKLETLLDRDLSVWLNAT